MARTAPSWLSPVGIVPFGTDHMQATGLAYTSFSSFTTASYSPFTLAIASRSLN